VAARSAAVGSNFLSVAAAVTLTAFFRARHGQRVVMGVCKESGAGHAGSVEAEDLRKEQRVGAGGRRGVSQGRRV